MPADPPTGARVVRAVRRVGRTLLGIVLTLALVVGVAACGNADHDTTTASNPSTPTATAAPGADDPTPTAETTGASPTVEASPTPTTDAAPFQFSDLEPVELSELPPEALTTLRLIRDGGPFPYDRDGTTFFNREGILPDEPEGYYAEYTVETPGSPDRGARRIVAGSDGELFYTDDHYDSFREIVA